jgi:iron-sulfur cluster assembly protein/iron-sulfur cluster insertion protein
MVVSPIGTHVEVIMSLASTVSIGKKQDPVVLTDKAVAKVAELLAQETGDEVLALRVAVKPGGCSGFSYEMFFDSEVAADDVVKTYGDVRVVVDAQSAEMLTGSELDYSDGLNDAGFHISNPNASRTCGCGSSFS